LRQQAAAQPLSALLTLDGSGRVLRSDAGVRRMFGPLETGADWTASLPPGSAGCARRLLAELAAGHLVDQILPLLAAELRWLRVRGRPSVDGDGWQLRLDDLTGRGGSSLVAQVIYDPLTRALNRRAFLELADLPAVATAQFAGVLVLDIRRFRRINEVWGRRTGDECLIQTARWLHAISRPSDAVVRLADAEFAVLYGKDSEVVAELRHSSVRSFRIQDHDVQLSLQAGWSERDEATSLVTALDEAETALAVAKRDAWRNVVAWTAEIAVDAAAAAAAEEAVHQAVQAGQEAVHFQPIVDVVTGRVTAVEALVRLGGPAADLPADQVLAASHRLGLTPTFASRIYDLAFSDGLRLRAVFPGCAIGVNVSREFLSTGLAIDTVLASARRCDVAPEQILLELTEDVATGLSTELLFSELRRAAAAGMRIAIDDFGRGETSLALLRTLPLTAIKLDRSLIPDPADLPGWEFLAATVSLLSRITRQITAEGIESVQQSARLRELGVASQQGYLFSLPRSADYWVAHGLVLPAAAAGSPGAGAGSSSAAHG
jgi:diguanylate cyclase (GGDEF)-like protein